MSNFLVSLSPPLFYEFEQVALEGSLSAIKKVTAKVKGTTFKSLSALLFDLDNWN